jgi:hypothetical protein
MTSGCLYIKTSSRFSPGDSLTQEYCPSGTLTHELSNLVAFSNDEQLSLDGPHIPVMSTGSRWAARAFEITMLLQDPLRDRLSRLDNTFVSQIVTRSDDLGGSVTMTKPGVVYTVRQASTSDVPGWCPYVHTLGNGVT